MQWSCESCGCCHDGGSPESNTPLSVDRPVYTTNLGPQDAFFYIMNHLETMESDGIGWNHAESLDLSNLKQMNAMQILLVFLLKDGSVLKVQEYLAASKSAELPIGQWLHRRLRDAGSDALLAIWTSMPC